MMGNNKSPDFSKWTEDDRFIALEILATLLGLYKERDELDKLLTFENFVINQWPTDRLVEIRTNITLLQAELDELEEKYR